MEKPKRIFIAGTDTGVGKTRVCFLLADYLRAQGLRVVTQKWIQCGPDEGHDSVVYRFEREVSPHLAARLENWKISGKKILDSVDALDCDVAIVEGSGGVLVPYNEKNLMIDLIKMPVILVARNRVGTINHTLLTIEALKQRQVEILGIVLNQVDQDVPEAVLKDNPNVVQRISKINSVAVNPHQLTLPHIADLSHSAFGAWASRVLKR